ncbi:MAG: DivIVA domain-containing protein [Myxococcota bacterium]
MPLTPLDVLQKQFGPARKGGYEAEEVHRFLDEVREAWEGALKENHRLREEIRGLQAELARFRGEHDEIKETLLLARRLSVELENTARREVDVLLGEARLESERLLATAQDEHRSLQEEVLRLKATRVHTIAQMRAFLDAQHRMLDEIDPRE